jgi:hypothetical protein
VIYDSAAPYRTSSYCGVSNCVEVAPLPSGDIAVRDSKDRSLVQTFTVIEWDQFVMGVKAGEFDSTTLFTGR